MGWAKYFEDNMSIYVGRLVMADSDGIGPVIVHQNTPRREENNYVKRLAQNGRRGIELSLVTTVDSSAKRRLQLNGWWWSKANNSWCNVDTVDNREFAKSIVTKHNAKMSIVQQYV